MSFEPEAVDDSADFVFGIARRLSVVFEIESFFVETDAVKPLNRLGKYFFLKCRINFMT
jgi:hypothetical protein